MILNNKDSAKNVKYNLEISDNLYSKISPDSYLVKIVNYRPSGVNIQIQNNTFQDVYVN